MPPLLSCPSEHRAPRPFRMNSGRGISSSFRLAKATLTLIPLFGIHEVVFIFATDEQTTGILRYIKVFFTLFLNSFQVSQECCGIPTSSRSREPVPLFPSLCHHHLGKAWPFPLQSDHISPSALLAKLQPLSWLLCWCWGAMGHRAGLLLRSLRAHTVMCLPWAGDRLGCALH